MAEPLLLSPADFASALADPACFERWSPLTGTPLVAIDVRAPARELGGTARARQRQLAAVALGVGGGPPAAPGSLAATLDVLVPGEAEAQAIATAVAQRPLASVALVQLLRLGETLALDHAILAESLVYSTLQGGPEFAAWLGTRKARQVEQNREPAVLLERSGDALVLRLNRPEKRNAFSREMRDALCEALALVLRDDSVRSVELRGEGAAFCSGGDLDEFGTLPDPATAHAVRSTRNAAQLLAACAGRVHAHVHGACIGAGAELPAFCARVVADESAFFALPEIAMGLVPGAGGTASLPRRIGRQRTAWLALTGARIDAHTARAFGLVDAVAPRAR